MSAVLIFIAGAMFGCFFAVILICVLNAGKWQDYPERNKLCQEYINVPSVWPEKLHFKLIKNQHTARILPFMTARNALCLLRCANKKRQASLKDYSGNDYPQINSLHIFSILMPCFLHGMFFCIVKIPRHCRGIFTVIMVYAIIIRILMKRPWRLSSWILIWQVCLNIQRNRFRLRR